MRLLYVLLLFCIGTNAAGVWPDTGEDSNSGYMSSAYGPRDKTSGEGYTYDFHRGIDIANPNSNGVYAFSGGTFEYVDWSSDCDFPQNLDSVLRCKNV